MPLFAALFQAVAAGFTSLIIALATLRESIRITGVVMLAGMYVAAVAGFNAFVSPLADSLFSTSYGQLIGLAFPPVAGTVITSLSILWATLAGNRFLQKFGALALPK